MNHYLSLLLLTAFMAAAIGSAIFYWHSFSSAKAVQGPVLIKSELTESEIHALAIVPEKRVR